MTRIRLRALLLALLLALTVLPVRAEQDALSAALDRAVAHLVEAVPSPAVGSIGGEWAVLGLARSGRALPEGYLSSYYRAAEQTVQERGGVLHRRKNSEYSRVILALTAVGADPTRVAGYDLTAPLRDVDATLAQGVNGGIWALIALDCGKYGTEELRGRYVDALVHSQLADGGWCTVGQSADADVTAMALQALAPHRDRADAAAAIGRGLDRLAALCAADGDYGSSEATAQSLVAVCRLGLLGKDERFSSVTDALLSYERGDGGFAHTADQTVSDPMASEQALYALVAAERAREGQSDLYTMDDVTRSHPHVTRRVVVQADKTFPDLVGRADRAAVETLAERGIVAGRGDGLFYPDDGLTRAEFATLVVQALGLPAEKAGDRFADVSPSVWYATFVDAAYEYGIVSGVGGGRFDPDGPVTREQASVMTARAAALCAVSGEAANADLPEVSPWAQRSVAFCRENGLWVWDDLLPSSPVLRGEMAQMLASLLARAKLL